MELQQGEWIKLLNASIEEEHWFLDAQHKREAFYTSIITAIIGATIAGVLKATEPFHYGFLIIGPIIVFWLAFLARLATKKYYKRFLETITIRAKIEQKLGITAGEYHELSKQYWENEPITPYRHIKARSEYEHSKDFCESRTNTGHQKSTNRLFIALMIMAGLMCVMLIAMIYLK